MSSRLGGVFTRKECWGVSARGWVLGASLFLITSGFVFLRAYPFLAVTARMDTNILVVEGWMPDYAIRAAAQEFASGKYSQVFSTGGPTVGSGGYINDFNTGASVAADLLRSAGVPSELVIMVPSRVMNRDRTYGSAVALREWFFVNEKHVKNLNVFTEGPHARRTRLLYQAALGNEVTVGVVAVHSPDYDSRHWWRYSEGVREVIGEGIAYIYARLSLALD